MSRTAKQMIDHFGSNKFVAISLGVTAQTVSNWATNNYIGREYRLPFFKLLKQYGYPNASLTEIGELIPVKKVAKNG